MASFSSRRSRISSIILLYLFLSVFYAEISVCYSAKVIQIIILDVYSGISFSTQTFAVEQIPGFFALIISLKIGWVSRFMWFIWEAKLVKIQTRL